jgi:SAM-dependent methyltransferase
VRRSTDRYAGTSLTAWEFARGKLRFDPIYRSLVCDGLLIGDRRPPRARTLVEIGCGQGLILALLSEARADVRSGRWPPHWRPPVFDRLVGVEKRRRVARIASEALAGEAEIITADARSVANDGAEVVLFVDVLHMMPRDQQEAVLASACASLSPEGRIIVREANAAGGSRFTLVSLSNRLKALAFGNWRQRFAFRSVDEWEACFARLGLRSEIRAMGQGTPFANVLFVVTRAEAATPSSDRTDTRTADVV